MQGEGPTCGQMLLPAPPLHVGVNHEHSVRGPEGAGGSALLKQLLHLAVIDDVILILILLPITRVLPPARGV